MSTPESSGRLPISISEAALTEVARAISSGKNNARWSDLISLATLFSRRPRVFQPNFLRH